MKRESIFPKMLLGVLVWAVVSLACAGSGTSGAASAASDPGATALIYTDDFSDPTSGWLRYRQAGVSDYEAGQYYFLVELENFFAWSVAGQHFNDVFIEVNSEFGAGADQAELAVMCRYRDSENFYFFSITSTGEYAIIKMSEGQENFLGADGYQSSTAINTGLASNQLRVECVGAQLSLTVNGTHLLTVDDPDYQAGDVGLLAGTFDTANASVYFDDFKVYDAAQ